MQMITTAIPTGLEDRVRTRLDVVGSYCEVHWTASNRLAKHQCNQCVYLVRGIESGLICLEMVYDAIEGVHRNDAIYWVSVDALQYLRVLTDKAAERRMESLEREAAEDKPLD